MRNRSLEVRGDVDYLYVALLDFARPMTAITQSRRCRVARTRPPSEPSTSMAAPSPAIQRSSTSARAASSCTGPTGITQTWTVASHKGKSALVALELPP